MSHEGTVRWLMARSRVHRLLSPLFLYPDAGTFSGLAGEGAGEAAGVLGNPDGLTDALKLLQGRLRDPIGLQSEHVRVFGHTLSEECSPYDTQYGEPHIFQQAHILADIAGYYRAFGLEVSDWAKERLDHISIELEFMAFLAYKEAFALTAHGEEPARICREAQRRFLNDHLGRWGPAFTRRLEAEAGGGFYRTLAQVTGKFLAFEADALGVTPVTAERSAPVAVEPEGRCFSCGVSDACFSGEES